MKNEKDTALMEAMEARSKEQSEEKQISQLITPTRKAKRQRSLSSLSVIPTGICEYSEFENLPRDIVAEIMSRLPTESLLRFNCLNKSCYLMIRCLINDPGFVANQHRRAEAHPTVLLVDERRLSRSNSLRVSVKLITDFIETTGEEEEIQCVTKDIDVSGLPRSFARSRRSNKVKVYYCNGILCLTRDFRALTFYNPVMNKFSTFRPKTSKGVDRESEVLVAGFGSDSGATSFKFVRILSSRKAQFYEPGNSNNSWREIEFSVRIDHISRLQQVYLRGCCVWLFPYSLLCLCFDVAKESFHASALPEELIGMKNFRYYIHLVPREGSLCLFYAHPWIPMDVWTMDIDDGSFSWRKWMRFDCPFAGFRVPLTFRRNDELLFETYCRDVASYNIHTKDYKTLPQIEVFNNSYYFGPYVNSLASVKWMIKHAR